MVICLERGADVHMAQLMPLPLTVFCFSKIQIGLPFYYRLTQVDPDRGPLKGHVCVCVFRSLSVCLLVTTVSCAKMAELIGGGPKKPCVS